MLVCSFVMNTTKQMIATAEVTLPVSIVRIDNLRTRVCVCS
jgi:hypothetical protein